MSTNSRVGHPVQMTFSRAVTISLHYGSTAISFSTLVHFVGLDPGFILLTHVRNVVLGTQSRFPSIWMQDNQTEPVSGGQNKASNKCHSFSLQPVEHCNGICSSGECRAETRKTTKSASHIFHDNKFFYQRTSTSKFSEKSFDDHGEMRKCSILKDICFGLNSNLLWKHLRCNRSAGVEFLKRRSMHEESHGLLRVFDRVWHATTRSPLQAKRKVFLVP